MPVTSDTPLGLVTDLYARFGARVEEGRRRLDRALTLTEKVLVAHLREASSAAGLVRGVSYAELAPDRVAMQDATAQMALLQFMTAGLDRVSVPTTVHCDHLIRAERGAEADLGAAQSANREVYNFLRTVSARYGIGFWKPGSGIIHQVVLERYAFPGGLMIGTDSHTPNAGGMSMLAIGVGGADAVDVMTGGTLNLRWPRVIGVHLTGSLSGWTSAKDVILRVAELLTVAGGTGAVVEYFGPGTCAISATGKATITNMGAEVGATTSVFPYDDRSAAYLKATGREAVADAASAMAAAGHLMADPEVVADPSAHYDRVLEIDLSTLEPQVVGPHTPDLARPASRLGAEARAEGWPLKVSQALVGSCTNSSYEDISRAASVARQASARGLRAKAPLLITPGSEQVRATIERDGLLADLEAIGATVLANACGPCIGQWARTDVAPGETNAIITSFNRNFPRRNDGSASTLAFIASPETTVAFALAGTFDFDPVSGLLDGVALAEPVGEELPADGFVSDLEGLEEPPPDGSGVEVVVDPASERLALLEPFAPWDGRDLCDMAVLLKAVGKCTTDHISAAGPWLRYRGHLPNISANLFLGARNAFTDEPGTGRRRPDDVPVPLPELARSFRDEGIEWVAVADTNYGEGSSREHAAMEPRYLGCRAVLARSFARIAETNLKKQGVLALAFVDLAVYDEVRVDDRVSILGLADLAPDRSVQCRLDRADGTSLDFRCTHTLSDEHIAWFRAGSALNLIRRRRHGLGRADGAAALDSPGGQEQR